MLNKLPKKSHGAAKGAIQEIWMAETKESAEKALGTFEEAYGLKYPKAVECLAKDREVLLTFYDFPAEHWIHLRTTKTRSSPPGSRAAVARRASCGHDLKSSARSSRIAKQRTARGLC